MSTVAAGRIALWICLGAVLGGGYVVNVGAAFADGPGLDVVCTWPEQNLPNNVTHKTRVPRGGAFDVVAVLDMHGATSPTAKITLTPPAGLMPVKLSVDGKESAKPETTVSLEKLAGAREVRWRFEVPWEIGKAAAEFRSDITAACQGFPELKKSVTVEQAVCCYETTMKRRLDLIAASPYCKLEVIGKTIQGRDMYLLRVSDFSVPAQGKKQIVIIGPYHGDEPSGVESAIDFAYELVTKKENKRLLEGLVFYILPCHNPDGIQMSKRSNMHGIDLNGGYKEPNPEPEAVAVARGVSEYKADITQALGIVDHQGWNPSPQIYHMGAGGPLDAASWQAVRNAGIRVADELDKPLYLGYDSSGNYGSPSARLFLAKEMGVPNYTLENAGMKGVGVGDYNIGTEMPNIVTEMALYYATADQWLKPEPVKPKAHPSKPVAFAPEHNYKAYKVHTPPVMDGKLDDPCWPKESIITGFLAVSPPPGPLALHTADDKPEKLWDTTVFVVYDDKNLYIACKAPDLKASVQDGCAMMFDTRLNQWSFFQFQANVNGTFIGRYDSSPGIPDAGTYKVSGCKVAGSAETGALEICIPFAAFNKDNPEMVDPEVASPPAPGTVWGVNFMRNQHDGKRSSSWAPAPKYGSLRSPWSFWGLTFMGEKP